MMEQTVQTTPGGSSAIACIAFSERGFTLAKTIVSVLGGSAVRSGQTAAAGDAPGGKAQPSAPVNVHTWTAEHFDTADALIYVGAAGIAVRAIAPHVKDKSTDPAVVVIDERALHVIPILSGHLGGANDLARMIAGITGSDCVITTATDVNDVFAVDEWSKRQNCTLLEKDKIMNISGTLLAGGRINVYSPWPIAGDVPEGIDVIPPDRDPYMNDWVEEWDNDWDQEEYEDPGRLQEEEEIDISLDIEVIKRRPLHLIPRICVLGVGCRRGTSAQAIEEMLLAVLENTWIHPAAICAVASIDLKKNEPGLTSFCEEHGWELLTYSSEQLQAAEGDFTPSAFVASITGVDNVCERSAVVAAGESGTLIQKKMMGGGVTMAIAMKDYRPDWSWRSKTE